MHRSFWKLLSLGVAGAFIAASITVWLTDIQMKGALRRGDFPAFYSLAVLAANEPQNLYNMERQREVQNQFWPSLNGEFLIASYPPYTAWMLQPLALLPAQSAKVVFTLLMVALVFAAARILRLLDATWKKSSLPPETLLFLCAPIPVAVMGGQNLALSLFLLLAIIALLETKSFSCDLLAGVLLGMWCFKPQYGLPMVVMVTLLGRPRVLGGVAPILTGAFFAGAAILGTGWLEQWSRFSYEFSKLNLETNGFQIISIVAGAREISRVLTGVPDTSLALTIMIVCYLGMTLALGWIIFRLPPTQRIVLGLPTTAAALTLLTPQTTFYDIGLFSVPLLLLTPRIFSLRFWGIILTGFAVIEWCRHLTRFPLYFVYANVLFVLLIYGIMQLRRANDTPY